MVWKVIDHTVVRNELAAEQGKLTVHFMNSCTTIFTEIGDDFENQPQLAIELSYSRLIKSHTPIVGHWCMRVYKIYHTA